jgi:hypothetical protein
MIVENVQFPYKLMLKMRKLMTVKWGLNAAQPNVTSNNDTSILKAAGNHPTQPTQCWNADSLVESAVQQLFTVFNAIQLSNKFFIL